MFFAMDEDDYINWCNVPGGSMFLDGVYIGRTVNEIIDAIKSDIIDWHNDTGEIEKPQAWYVFDGDKRRKVLFKCAPSIVVNHYIVEE